MRGKGERIAILTSRESWFAPYATAFASTLRRQGYPAQVFHHHDRIPMQTIVFILGYHRLVPQLARHEHNLVVHESALPKGRGWSPFFWQILAGKKTIPVVLFEASDRADAGMIYLKDRIRTSGHELHDELRHAQAVKSMEICFRFLTRQSSLRGKRQQGEPTTYRRRTPKDSVLDINTSLKKQFDRLRVADNERYPAFFRYKGYTYILKIYKKTGERGARNGRRKGEKRSGGQKDESR